VSHYKEEKIFQWPVSASLGAVDIVLKVPKIFTALFTGQQLEWKSWLY
jgi:hypothetical protein